MLDNIRGFHIEPTNICTLKCPGCARTRFINQWPQHWKNYNLDIDVLLKFLDVDLTSKPFSLCGNYGDPIYHPDFIEFVAKLKQRGATVNIATNGSYQKQEWWYALTNLLTAEDCVTFGVDGIPSNFTQYRINADWSTIEQGMKISAESKCQTVWKYIPFSFNSSDVESARQLSQQLGIKKFTVSPSDRFDEETEFLKPTEDLLGSRYQAQVQWKATVTDGGIVNPKCSQGKEHFITADGYYSPCCFIADHRFYYKTIFGKNKKMFSIKDTTLSNILSCPQVIDFYSNLEKNTGCQYNCPAG